jgi:hypothetical protein
LALRKTLDHSNLDSQTKDSPITHLAAVLETKFKDFTKGRGAAWRRDNSAGEVALELLMQICGAPMRGLDQAGVISGTSVRVSHLWPSRDSSILKDHAHTPFKENVVTATPTSSIPARNPEPLPIAAANHLAHVSTLASLDARLAHIGSIQDTREQDDASSSIITNATFDVETNDFEDRLRALEGELEVIDQDVSRKLEDMVGIWEEYAPLNGESGRYEFGDGEASRGVPEALFEVRIDILYRLLRNITKTSQAPENGLCLQGAFRKLPALSFQEAVAAIRQEIQLQVTTAPREEEEEEFLVELNNLQKELVDMRESEENAHSSPVRPAVVPSTPTTAKQSRLPVPSPSPWKNAFQPSQKRLATPQTIKKLQFGPLPSPVLRIPAPSFHKSTDSNGSDEKVWEPTTLVLSPERPRAEPTPKTIKREQAKRKALNLPAPASRPSISMTPLPSTNISAMFGDMTMDQGNIDTLPPFTSPWRTPLKSSQTSHRTPRKSVLWGSGTFKRTPLKTGARLSSIVPPVHQSYYLAGVANVQPNLGTPRASLDEACDEVRIVY